MDYKMMAVDMDGTLLNDNKYISDYNLKMINKAINKGIKFVIASGRIPGTLKLYEEIIGQNQPIICSNGSIILDHNKNVIYSNSILKDSLIEVVNILKSKKDTYFHFYHDNILCSEQFNYTTKKFYNFNRKCSKEHRIEIRLIKDAEEYILKTTSSINKIVVIDENLEYLGTLREKINKIRGIEITKSEPDNLEILAEGTTKGNGLKILAEHYNIPIEQCIAIGNDENDISMIKAAGLGVAMKNGREYIRQQANYVTENDNNNGAIGEIIEKFILEGRNI